MSRSRNVIRRSTALLGVTAATLVAATPAQASDVSVRKAVVVQEHRLDTAVAAFAEGTMDTTSAVGRERARDALGTVQRAVRKARTAVVAQRATAANVKRRSTMYVAALDRTAAGFRTFDTGLRVFDPDAPQKSVALIKTARAELKSAASKRDAARKLFGG